MKDHTIWFGAACDLRSRVRFGCTAYPAETAYAGRDSQSCRSLGSRFHAEPDSTTWHILLTDRCVRPDAWPRQWRKRWSLPWRRASAAQRRIPSNRSRSLDRSRSSAAPHTLLGIENSESSIPHSPEAEVECRAALSLAPRDSFVPWRSETSLSQQDKRKEAERLYKQALALDPSLVLGHVLLANALIGAGPEYRDEGLVKAWQPCGSTRTARKR